MLVPSPSATRAVAATGLLASVLTHLRYLPEAFPDAAYLGVGLVTMMGLSTVAAVLVLAGDGAGVWWFIAGLGATALGGYGVAAVVGLPLVPRHQLPWSHPLAITSGFAGAVLLGLAAWVLAVRWRCGVEVQRERERRTGSDRGDTVPPARERTVLPTRRDVPPDQLGT